MVVIQIKTAGDQDSFLYEAVCDTSNDAVIRELVEIWNLRIRLRQLSGAIRDLARYGPMKDPQKAGLDTVAEQYKGLDEHFLTPVILEVHQDKIIIFIHDLTFFLNRREY